MRKPTKAKKTRDAYGNVRLNLRLEPKLEMFARDYAVRHHTTVTQLIVDYLTELQEKERHERVDQI
jgi:hypothetical protein